MIILKESDGAYPPFNSGAAGFTMGFGKNFFLQKNVDDISIARHELGHCNGLDEFAYDFGITSRTKTSSDELIDNVGQKNSSNVMGYNGIDYNKPRLDFYSWQISILRENIKNRIKK